MYTILFTKPSKTIILEGTVDIFRGSDKRSQKLVGKEYPTHGNYTMYQQITRTVSKTSSLENKVSDFFLFLQLKTLPTYIGES